MYDNGDVVQDPDEGVEPELPAVANGQRYAE
jgi:hypothetical protein